MIEIEVDDPWMEVESPIVMLAELHLRLAQLTARLEVIRWKRHQQRAQVSSTDAIDLRRLQQIEGRAATQKQLAAQTFDQAAADEIAGWIDGQLASVRQRAR